MIRSCAILLLPAALMLSPSHAEAQWGRPHLAFSRPYNDTLPGVYANVSGGGTCEVHPDRRGYVFVNEKGSEALFAYDAPGRLRMIDGAWNPNTVVSVSRDRRGHTVLRFDEPGTPSGYWVSE